MSSVQGPASTPQPSGPGESGQMGKNDRAQEKEAERSSGEFDMALKKKGADDKTLKHGHGDMRGPQGERGEARGDIRGNDGNESKKEGLEDLFGKLHSRKKETKEGVKDSVKEGAKDGIKEGAKDGIKEGAKDTRKDVMDGDEAIANSEGAKIMEARMGKTAEVQGVDNKQMAEKIDKIVDKIMVSNAADVKAVKVDFKSDVLPGTEMMIRKDATTGKMTIEFTTTSAESFNFLNKGEQALMDSLNKKMGGDVEVNIKMQGGGTDQDTGDGRSREQYQAEDDDDDADI